MPVQLHTRRPAAGSNNQSVRQTAVAHSTLSSARVARTRCDTSHYRSVTEHHSHVAVQRQVKHSVHRVRRGCRQLHSLIRSVRGLNWRKLRFASAPIQGTRRKRCRCQRQVRHLCHCHNRHTSHVGVRTKRHADLNVCRRGCGGRRHIASHAHHIVLWREHRAEVGLHVSLRPVFVAQQHGQRRRRSGLIQCGKGVVGKVDHTVVDCHRHIRHGWHLHCHPWIAHHQVHRRVHDARRPRQFHDVRAIAGRRSHWHNQLCRRCLVRNGHYIRTQSRCIHTRLQQPRRAV